MKKKYSTYLVAGLAKTGDVLDTEYSVGVLHGEKLHTFRTGQNPSGHVDVHRRQAFTGCMELCRPTFQRLIAKFLTTIDFFPVCMYL